jgi:SAM-dependent methyltransferase
VNKLIHNEKLKHTPSRIGREWFQDESFWDEFAPFMFDETRWTMADTEVERIIALSGIAPPAKVLDLCCGVGRHSLAFARRGFTVTGVDITKSYLEAARESAAAENLEIEFIHEDGRSFRRPGEFALCVNLGASFGYFSDADDDALVLRRCRENLAASGAFVLETIGKETAARAFVESETVERDGWKASARYSVVGDWEKLGNAWRAQKENTVYEQSFAIRLYAGTELRELLLRAGFGNPALYGDLDGRAYDQRAEMLVAEARKTELGRSGLHAGGRHR